VLGPLTRDELAVRVTDDGRPELDDWLAELTSVAVSSRSASRASGASPPPRTPHACATRSASPCRSACRRRSPNRSTRRSRPRRALRPDPRPLHPPRPRRAARHLPEVARLALGELVASGRLVEGEFRPGGRETEWCDAEVLRRLRRRSLAALRKEVEPVDGVGARQVPAPLAGRRLVARGDRRAGRGVAVLQGAAIRRRPRGRRAGAAAGEYRPADLDLLCSTGEVVWLGAGAVGAHDGRVRLVFRDQVAALVPPPDPSSPTAPDDEHHRVLREHLRRSGAHRSGPTSSRAVAAARLPYDDPTVLAALWDLVWAGEVTNDTLAPLRAKVAGGANRRASGARSRPNQLGTARRHARVSAAGPPAGAGRWSLTAPLFEPAPSPTEAITQRALQLLERYGVLTREMALAEGAQGGSPVCTRC
jgi:ATP-dependent helicase Lhr and Lhr-like helicase